MFTDLIEKNTVPYRARKAEIIEIGMGEVAHKNTLKIMKNMINDGIEDWHIRETAQNIIRGIPERDKMGEANALFEYVQKNCRYTSDPCRLEMVQSPEVMLSDINEKGIATGDCDDFSVLLCTLLKSVGFQVRLKAVAFKGSDKLSHVYLEVRINGKFIPADAIRKDKNLGWESNAVSRQVLLDV
jgi:hypothetical protein